MAEVPEHLLRRSRERRKALGLPVEGDDDAAESASADDAPAAVAEEAAPEVEASIVTELEGLGNHYPYPDDSGERQ